MKADKTFSPIFDLHNIPIRYICNPSFTVENTEVSINKLDVCLHAPQALLRCN